MSRPKADVSANQVQELAAMGCTIAEIATVCGCSSDTLYRRFAAAIKMGREAGRESLRRLQWKNAKAGNVTMQIWLGKQLLGQSDKQDSNVNTTIIVKDQTPPPMPTHAPLEHANGESPNGHESRISHD